MAAQPPKDEISDLIARLQKAGAKVTTGDKSATPVTKQLLQELKSKSDEPQDFDAWVSWSKSF